MCVLPRPPAPPPTLPVRPDLSGRPDYRPGRETKSTGSRTIGAIECDHERDGDRGSSAPAPRLAPALPRLRGAAVPPPAPSRGGHGPRPPRSEEHTSELQSHVNLVCRLLLEKKKKNKKTITTDTKSKS